MFLEKSVPIPIFKIATFFNSELYEAFKILTLCQIYVLQIIYPTLPAGCLFVLLIVTFAVQELFSLI